MHALTQSENTRDEERVAGPVGATPPAMEHAARPRCLFCRYRLVEIPRYTLNHAMENE